MTHNFYHTEHFSPDYVRDNPVLIFIESLDKKFETLTVFNLVRGSLRLKQSICSESYFIWGGFNSSQLSFECYADDLQEAPTGKIQLYLIPTRHNNDGTFERLDAEKTALFTGYIETAEPSNIPGNWRVTAYDRLYRVRNNRVVDWLQRYMNGHINEGTHLSWYAVERAIASSQLGLPEKDTLPEFTKNVWYPENREITSENGVDLLREFALCCQRFGMLNGEGKLEYIEVQDSNTGSEAYDVLLYDPKDFSYSAGHVWLPKYFISEPRTNIFYTTDETTSEEDYYNNFYTISNSPILGDKDWLNERYECDEYGTPSSKYSASNLPAGIFDTNRMCLTSGQEYYCQEYKIKVLSDPTIPMGSIIWIYKDGANLVRSYIMERTITFSSTQTIECEMSANNAPYNEVVPEWDYGVKSANAKINDVSEKMAFVSDGTQALKLRGFMCMSQDTYKSITPRSDTIYFTYDDSGGKTS